MLIITGMLKRLLNRVRLFIYVRSYAPAQGAFSDDAVCLSVTYIGPNSKTERPRKTKIGTKVAHVTRDSDTTFKVKRSRSPGRFGLLYWQANMDIELVTDPYACISCHLLQPWSGAYCGGLPPNLFK